MKQDLDRVSKGNRCGDCRHSHLGTQGGFAEVHMMCRAHPPVPRVIPGAKAGDFNLTAMYAPIDPNGTCGEFDGAVA